MPYNIHQEGQAFYTDNFYTTRNCNSSSPNHNRIYPASSSPNSMLVSPSSIHHKNMPVTYPGSNDFDMQPLDLSVRSNREEPMAKKPRTDELRTNSSASSYNYENNYRGGRMCPYPPPSQNLSRSPNPPMSSSPHIRSESPYYSHHHTSHAYYNGNSQSSSLSINAPHKYAAAISSSPIQSESGIASKVIPGHPSLFRPFNSHTETDMEMYDLQQGRNPFYISKSENKPAYLDMDYSVQFHKTADNYQDKPKPFVHSVEHKGEAEHRQHANLVPLKNSHVVKCDSKEISDGQTVAHTTGKIQCSSEDSHFGYFSSAKKGTNHRSGYFKDFTSEDALTSPTSAQSVTPGSSGASISGSSSPKEPKPGQQLSTTPTPVFPQVTVTNKENACKNKSKKSLILSRSAGYFTSPDSSSAVVGSVIDAVVAEKNKLNDRNIIKITSPENVNSEERNKISLLDFWISKILMERSEELPKKSCGVDYKLVDGHSKIRISLVDLIELQVEQSLKT
ncbi:uncharacterized protein LOC131937594 [Physella acuta]|uniref:uncharacterized protein LOC131937594 n=1 Tax=Physella acuta TaxID=109671 RepID=UPI0027DB8640|nr:uncharacterized protein LOC131937594 [Physella acuta]XP_059151127.1 uncharacterized protein LOC131937594 [Physella acuta]XP_059151128.1 uncharacterized protein LOC131937594 [Physella acuta]XP_059151129.1 uncharacterized protein LOC131937594 [Physella acuta]